ncbi:unnamed protein product [Caenorhabditis bovis]|uniref:DEP domain-containing protein n=1 Tax=Caenorhabditis bovis TaxID=2654633 RepID=A0A8S1F2N5_9PELO|nr:unnamed protein product [Caenorhabditis bovis]
MRKAQLIKNNKINLLTTYKNSFKGEELIEWLMREKNIKRSEALEFSQELIDRHVGKQTSKEAGMTFSPDRYYQLVEDDENKPLNANLDDDDTQRRFDIVECNAKLAQLLEDVYIDILDDDNRSIVYQNLQFNANFNNYAQFARQLKYLDLTSSTSSIDERLAFFVNIYNIMLIHMTLKCGPPQSIWQRRKLVNSTYYQIGDHKYALHSVMNGILRGNRKGPGMLWKAFGKHDGRLVLALPQCEPLVHFAVITGSKTTPPLRVYSSKVFDEQIQNIYRELRDNAKSTLLFGDKYLRVDIKKNVIHLGKTFKWYCEDFGGTKEKMIQWILEILDDDDSDKKHNLERLYFTGDYSVEYIPFDWSTNGKGHNSKDGKLESEKKTNSL